LNRLVLLFVVLNGVVAAHAQQLRTVPVFRHAIIADGVGAANLIAADIDGDGKADAVTCSRGAPYAVGVRDGVFSTIWHGAAAGCVGVTVGDRNGDGGAEVIVVATQGTVYRLQVYDPRTLAGPAASIPLPEAPRDVAIGNVDLDGANEIVVVGNAATYVFDGATLALEWTATGYGGHTVAIADVDGNAQVEIVVNGSTGSVLDAVARTSKWGYVGGFGAYMAVGNVDGDSKAEIVFTVAYGSSATILNGDTFTTTTVALPENADALGIGDANGDGANEILLGDNQWGSVAGVRPSDAVVLWSVYNPEHGTSAITTGDIDGDGANEILWGAGLTSSGDDALFIANPITDAVKFRSEDLDGPFSSAAGDLDQDGRPEIVVASHQSESGYSGGEMEIFDANSGASKGRLNMGYEYDLDIARLAVGQFDNDSQREILALGENWYDPTLASWDGQSRAIEWSVSTDSYNGAYFLQSAIAVANIDGDPVDEIFVAMSDQKISVLNGASSVIQKSLVVPGTVTDFALADLDSNSVPDLVVLTGGNTVTVYETATWTSLGSFGVTNAFRVAATSLAGGTIAVLGSGTVSTYDFSTLTQRWNCTASPADLRSLSFGAVAGTSLLFVGTNGGIVKAYPIVGSFCPAPMTLAATSTSIESLRVTDVTGDGRTDLILDSATSSEVLLLGLSTETRGDVNSDSVIGNDDVDALVDYTMRKVPGLSPSGDANSDQRISVEDAFHLIHYLYGAGASPLP
jgi:hypothetical protein